MTAVARVDVEHDHAGVRPHTDPVGRVARPVLVGPLGVGARVVEPVTSCPHSPLHTPRSGLP